VSGGPVLVLNAGSATLKATVLDLPSTQPRFDQTVEWSAGASPDQVGQAVDAVVARLGHDDALVAVGHRVVHGGETFTEPTSIDDAMLADLDRVSDLAPLHNPRAVDTIRAARQRLDAVPHVAAFDTAFHATLPEVARRYPVPDRWVAEYGVRRFGFHGLSVEWSVHEAATALGRAESDLGLVVAHLGGGCSVTAVARGRSVHTSMGMTPLEGLMMGTRAGSIDPGIVFRLIRSGIAVDDVEQALDHDSGLRGVGGTDDMRRLLASEREGDARAALAVALFVDRAAAGIAAAAIQLDRLDALVFTGGIGERAASVRARICHGLGLLGVPEPPGEEGGADGVVARAADGPAVMVVQAREDVVIARAALSVVEA
jgi:acetate kinase